IYTALLTISIEFMLHFIFVRKNSRKKLKLEEEKLAERISTTFIFSQKDAINYFLNLSKINYSAKKYTKYILITNKTKSNDNDKKSKTILFPIYSYSPIMPQDLIDTINNIKKQSAEKLIICGYKIDNSAYKLAQKIKEMKIILLDSKDCFLKLIKKYNFFPENLKEFSIQEKLKFKEVLKLSLSRKHAKGYLITSLILLLSSFVVRLNIYYVIMSSFLLLLSLLSFFLPQKSYKLEDNIL
ncbi:MAG: hypothetical protein PHS54_06870, partial [Clostridia bacterium]|nr:hypothetical protein [Clostridia bacterium]